ncbi:MAG: DUF721 domain-containing protein [Cyanobacteria bacterium HKST-UBA06]|nr:DUF721 domain-containing protein [Cyanobacteria bacterium HKST-UBA05]MCA9800089.1 DUF721 domain-containing protein [Cyanobacteria bacterium HKST-UBA04]MCA9807599.1 DUF721 domain-containing protein [Cyanobacteria bacterium HKST-UBA06]MCA9842495.1 DUF721 domain-containing protein [Cyanobacteria bacterium HKST-UBA03]
MTQRRAKQSQLSALGAILPQVVASLSLDERVQDMGIMNRFAELVDPVFSGWVEPRRLRLLRHKRVLDVVVANATVKTEFQFHCHQLLSQLNSRLIADGLDARFRVDDIRLQVGSLQATVG